MGTDRSAKSSPGKRPSPMSDQTRLRTALPADAKVTLTPLLSEGIAMWKTINANDALGHYPDWASPTLLKTIDDNSPHLLAGDQTPEAFVDALDADYQAYLKSKK